MFCNCLVRHFFVLAKKTETGYCSMRTLVAIHFVSFFVLLSVFLKVIKILARSFISLFLGRTKMSKIKVTDAEIMTLCF